MRRIIPIVVASLLASVVARSPAAAANGPTLVDIQGIADLHAAFNKDQGKVRLVLLVSPT